MGWKDILKNVITQNRVKEIEDIDIDIDDDDCLRWLNKLYNIITKYPEGKMIRDEIRKEEYACYVKNKWEDKEDLMFRGKDSNIHSEITRFTSRKNSPTKEGNAYVYFSLFNREGRDLRFERIKTTYAISLSSNVSEPAENHNDLGKEMENWAKFETDDREKVIKVTKEICNYLNLDYNRMLERFE